MAAMQQFFQDKGVPLDFLSKLKPSCFHHSLSASQIGWDSIQKTIVKVAQLMTGQLPATHMALMTLQMVELEEICQAIEQFGAKISGKVSLLDPSVVFTCMKSIVKHSNALAFRLDSASEQSITLRVDALIYHITETLHVCRGLTNCIHDNGDHCKSDKGELVCTTCHCFASLLKASGLPFNKWSRILETPRSINVITDGALEKVTAALEASGLSFNKWSRILETNGAINIITDGALKKVTAALELQGCHSMSGLGSSKLPGPSTSSPMDLLKR